MVSRLCGSEARARWAIEECFAAAKTRPAWATTRSGGTTPCADASPCRAAAARAAVTGRIWGYVSGPRQASRPALRWLLAAFALRRPHARGDAPQRGLVDVGKDESARTRGDAPRDPVSVGQHPWSAPHRVSVRLVSPGTRYGVGPGQQGLPFSTDSRSVGAFFPTIECTRTPVAEVRARRCDRFVAGSYGVPVTCPLIDPERSPGMTPKTRSRPATSA
jgi:hypothetical protein